MRLNLMKGMIKYLPDFDQALEPKFLEVGPYGDIVMGWFDIGR